MHVKTSYSFDIFFCYLQNKVCYLYSIMLASFSESGNLSTSATAMEMSSQDRNESINNSSPAGVEKRIPKAATSSNHNNNEATVTPAFQMKDVSTIQP